MKLGDLWVKLGLRSEEYSKGLDDAKRQSQSFGGVFDKIKGWGLAAWAAIGAAAVKAFKDIVLESNKLGDQWRETVGGMKSAWNTFTNSLLNWDWEGFWDRVNGAYQSGKALAGATDSLFEQLNATKMLRADVEAENARLRVEMSDQNKTYAERQAAAEKYLANIKPIYEKEAQIYKDYMLETQYNWLSQSGLDRNSVNRQALEDFLRAGARLTPEMAQNETFRKIAEGYQAAGDAINGPLVDAYVNAKNAAGAFDSENRRVLSTLNTIQSQMGKGGGTETPTVAAPALLDAASLFRRAERRDSILSDYWAADAEAAADELADVWNGLYKEIDEGWQDFFEDFRAELTDGMVDLTEEMSHLSEDFAAAVTGGFADGIQQLTDALFGLEQMDGGRIVAALLSPLADMVTTMGTLIMTAGMAELKLFEALMNPTPASAATAILAGAGLIAIGAAAKAGLKALAGGGSPNAATSTYAGGATGAGNGSIQTEMTIHIDGRIKGSDIVLSGQRTLNNWAR